MKPPEGSDFPELPDGLPEIVCDLPPLPERYDIVTRLDGSVRVWSEGDMQAYAREAVRIAVERKEAELTEHYQALLKMKRVPHDQLPSVQAKAEKDLEPVRPMWEGDPFPPSLRNARPPKQAEPEAGDLDATIRYWASHINERGDVTFTATGIRQLISKLARPPTSAEPEVESLPTHELAEIAFGCLPTSAEPAVPVAEQAVQELMRLIDEYAARYAEGFWGDGRDADRTVVEAGIRAALMNKAGF